MFKDIRSRDIPGFTGKQYWFLIIFYYVENVILFYSHQLLLPNRKLLRKLTKQVITTRQIWNSSSFYSPRFQWLIQYTVLNVNRNCQKEILPYLKEAYRAKFSFHKGCSCCCEFRNDFIMVKNAAGVPLWLIQYFLWRRHLQNSELNHYFFIEIASHLDLYSGWTKNKTISRYRWSSFFDIVLI